MRSLLNMGSETTATACARWLTMACAAAANCEGALTAKRSGVSLSRWQLACAISQFLP